MDGQRRFAVIGTDARLAAAGRALARAGFAVGGPDLRASAIACFSWAMRVTSCSAYMSSML